MSDHLPLILMQRCKQQNDESAFGSLVRFVSPKIYRSISDQFGNVLNHYDVEDLVSLTLHRVWRSRDKYDENRPLMPWVFAIARNVALDELKRRRVKRTICMADLSSIPIDSSNDQVSETDLLYAALANLSPRDEMIILSDLRASCSTAELAEKLGTSQVAVRKARSRAKRRLRTHYLLLQYLERFQYYASLGPTVALGQLPLWFIRLQPEPWSKWMTKTFAGRIDKSTQLIVDTLSTNPPERISKILFTPEQLESCLPSSPDEREKYVSELCNFIREDRLEIVIADDPIPVSARDFKVTVTVGTGSELLFLQRDKELSWDDSLGSETTRKIQEVHKYYDWQASGKKEQVERLGKFARGQLY